MDLKGKSLPEWLEKTKKNKHFPFNGRVDYYRQYSSVKEWLDNHVHPEIASMTLTFDDSIYLNKHGTEHIDVVIQRLTDLVDTGNAKDVELSPYEVYILLMATQLHDTGHIKMGRLGHETAASNIIEKLGTLMGTETAEKKMIYQIAQAHGGRTIDGQKDKIDRLPIKEPILNFPIKARMLAALLRLADELADDFSRSNKVIGNSGELKKGSEIFFRYASVLQSVEIDHEGGEIKLHYMLEKKDLNIKYGKAISKDAFKEVFLIDEIYTRLYKMYLEFSYCMRFIYSSNRLNTITAKIAFVDPNSFADFREPMMLKLSEKGYPEYKAKDLYELCPESLFDNGNKIDGEFLFNYIKTHK